MSTYRAPLREMQFVLRELAGVDTFAQLPGLEDVPDVLDAILEEALTFASEALDPINRTGDIEGCHWNDGAVTTPAGFKDDSIILATQSIVRSGARDLSLAYACSVPFARMWGVVAGGWQLARSAAMCAAKIATARCYADHMLSQTSWLTHSQFELDRQLLVVA